MLAVIDYGIGNLRSVLNAMRHLGREPKAVASGAELGDADAIVLPGVGAFGDTMANLRKRGFDTALQRQVIEKKTPFLGICIGMEVLLSRSFEHGEHQGFGWIEGDVVRFEPTPQVPNLRVPHVGWNNVRFGKPDPLVEGLGAEQDFYFVHSYYCAPKAPEVVVGACDYGVPFASIVARDNIYGVQFHPEKSHRAGIALLRNWLERVAHC
jgi:glutamine amidotransferase